MTGSGILGPVLIVGARSDIGRALARAYAAHGRAVVLAGRGDLAAEAADLALRVPGARVRSVACDVTDGAPDAFFAGLGETPGTVVLVAGLLGDAEAQLDDDAAATAVMRTNYEGPARYALAAARAMRAVRGACLIGVSSVAGERGRGSNPVYGSAKAGFSALLSGLRNRYARDGLHVLTVKPGFVATQMTADLELPAPLTASPEQVAQAILAAHVRRRDTIYVRARWRWIMAVVRAIPERVFKRLEL